MTTVDAHHHFWDPAGADYPWMTGELAALRHAFGPRDLAPLLAAAGIDLTILVQTRSSVEETRDFLALAGTTPFIAGVVGWVDLTARSVADDVAQLRGGAGGGQLVAIRHQVHDEADPEWLRRADVRRGLRAVASAGLTYDLLVRARELPAALEVVRAVPDLPFVIDHAAKPPIASGAFEPWSSRLRELALEPNTTCKLSGLVTEADWKSWTPDGVRPWVDAVVEMFGPARLMFGSDWPVCLLAASYERVAALAHELLGELSATERGRIFGGTAVETYRLRAS